ncbi:hypothetical protein [Azospirillum argentinense]
MPRSASLNADPFLTVHNEVVERPGGQGIADAASLAAAQQSVLSSAKRELGFLILIKK